MAASAARELASSPSLSASGSTSLGRYAGDVDQSPFTDRPELPAHIPADPEGAAALSDRDREIIDFERQWWRYAGSKEQAVRELFDLIPTRYYQILNSIIDRPEAMAYDPIQIKRLRRRRTSRQESRTSRRLGSPA